MATDTTDSVAAADAVVTDPNLAANPTATASTDSAVVQGQGQDAANPEAAEAEKVNDAPAVNGAPDAYEAFTLPEGFVLEGERLEAATALLKDLNLSQVGAQKAIEAFCKMDGENAGIREQVMAEATQAKRESWASEAKSELGAKYDETLVLARAGVAAVNSPKLLEAFDAEGWGNHPELIKAFAKLGELTRGSGPQGLEAETTRVDRSSIPIEKRLYPNMA